MKIEQGQKWKSRDGLRTLEVKLVGPNPQGIASLQVIHVYSQTSGRTYDMSERTLRRSYTYLSPITMDNIYEEESVAFLQQAVLEQSSTGVYETNEGLGEIHRSGAADEWYRQMGDEHEPAWLREPANWADSHPWVIALIAAVMGFVVMYIAVWSIL